MWIPARLLVPTLIATSVVSVVPVAAAISAAADTPPTTLAMTSFSRIVVDQAHGHLFLAPGRTGSALTVTDLAGTQVGRSGPIAGPTGMALTPDGSSLWVAAASGDALVRVDTASLAVVQTVPLPAGTCPGDVAVVGTRVVYGYSCNTYGGSGAYGGLGVVDAATGADLGRLTSGPSYMPVLATASGGQVYAADASLSPTSLYLYSLTGSVPGTAPLQFVASRSNIGSNLQDFAPSPDGTKVVTANGSPYEHDVFSVDNLSSAGVFASGPYPNAVAWSGDGQVVAVGTYSPYDPDVRIYASGSATLQRAVDFGSGTYLMPRGLAISVDGSQTWAVTGDVYGGNLALRVLSPTAPAPSSLTLAANPSAAYTGSTTSLAGLLTSGGAPLAGVAVAVSRTAGGTTTQLPSVSTLTDGSFGISTVLPTTSGIVTYQASYAGDVGHASASATATVLAWSTAPTLTLKLSQPSQGSSSVSGLVTLAYAGTDSPTGVTVHLSRSVNGSTTVLAEVVTTPNGAANFSDTAPSGTSTYTASVDATSVHPAASATAIVGVAGLPTVLSATASLNSAYVGQPVTVSGSLTSGQTPLGSREVTVQRTGCGGSSAAVALGTAVTGSNGSYTVTDNPPKGTCRYDASFAGDGTYAAARATVSVTVQLQFTSLSITATRGTGSSKKSVTVTAHLGTTHVGRLVTITATPSGGTPVTIVSGSVNGSGDLVGIYQPRATTTYTATFGGDDWYLPATAQVTLS